jgi:N-carbamoylputrescine amidase
MRVTVCELPHEPNALAEAWAGLAEHVRAHDSELVVLPELATVEPLWESAEFDDRRWSDVEAAGEAHLDLLPELGARHVVGTRPVRARGRRLNQAYLWSADCGVESLRSKYHMPDEPGNWEATWFDRGDPAFPVFHAGAVPFGVNICTELWALETYAAYAALRVELLLAPRATSAATGARWMAVGIVAAVRSGAFCLSSNRVDPTEACGGVGWIVDPAGTVLALTSAAAPFATRELDLAEARRARGSYPRNVFARAAAAATSAPALPADRFRP